MIIYVVNGFNIFDKTMFDSSTNPNALQEAEVRLAQTQAHVWERESYRFSICASFIDGTNMTWRAIEDSDPEDTVCQVFNHMTGTYTEYPNKTLAFAANEQLKNKFLEDLKLNKVYEIDSIPAQEGEI